MLTAVVLGLAAWWALAGSVERLRWSRRRAGAPCDARHPRRPAPGGAPAPSGSVAPATAVARDGADPARAPSDARARRRRTRDGPTTVVRPSPAEIAAGRRCRRYPARRHGATVAARRCTAGARRAALRRRCPAFSPRPLRHGRPHRRRLCSGWPGPGARAAVRGGRETDAFLVAWTVPEIAATLLIEDAMALRAGARVQPRALARRPRPEAGPARRPTPYGRWSAATLPRLLAGSARAGRRAAGRRPRPYWSYGSSRPGCPTRRLAVDCTRLTALTVLTFGLAGYCSAALRAHRRFVPPAAIYVAYNVGIIATDVRPARRCGACGRRRSGSRWAALLMVLVQLPVLRCAPSVRAARPPRGPSPARPSAGAGRTPPARAAGPRVLAPVLLFALCRQSQVLVERFLASSLPAGAISHLNYAQKVAQMPMVLSLMMCTVTFPVVAQRMADGDTERARRRVERDLALAALVVLLGAALVVACAPQIIELLFQRGAFTAPDTAATAAVMRVYAARAARPHPGRRAGPAVLLGRPAHLVPGRPRWPRARSSPPWIGAGDASAPGACYGIAAANAAGITVTAAAAAVRHSAPGWSPIRRPRGCAAELAGRLARRAVRRGRGRGAAPPPRRLPRLGPGRRRLTVPVVFRPCSLRALGRAGASVTRSPFRPLRPLPSHPKAPRMSAPADGARHGPHATRPAARPRPLGADVPLGGRLRRTTRTASPSRPTGSTGSCAGCAAAACAGWASASCCAPAPGARRRPGRAHLRRRLRRLRRQRPAAAAPARLHRHRLRAARAGSAATTTGTRWARASRC